MEDKRTEPKLPENRNFYLLVAFVIAIVALLICVGNPPWVAAIPGLVFVLLYRNWPPKFPPIL